MSPFEYLSPTSTEEAVNALREAGEDARLLAGGMTLLPAMKFDLAAPSLLVDLRRIAALKRIELDKGELVVGAMNTHQEIASSALIQQYLPVLAKVAAGIGDAQVRHRGTIGGSLSNNDPAADYPAACLGLNATIETTMRTIPVSDFFRGLFTTALETGEIVTALRFKPVAKAGYAKFVSQASRFALVGVFVAKLDEKVRVTVTGAAGDGVIRIPALEKALTERFDPSALPAHNIPVESLMSDLHATAAYRSHLINVMAKRAMYACLGKRWPGLTRHGGFVQFEQELR